MKRVLEFASRSLCVVMMTIPAWGQDCATQAQGSLDKARAELAAGDFSRGRQWIEQAALECGTSANILKRIAELYEVIGDAEMAESYSQRADAQRRGTAIKLQNTDSSARPAAAANTNIPSCDGSLSGKKGMVRDKYAIVVGVSEFRNPAYNLKFAAKDANDFANVLQDPRIGRFKADSDHVKLLLNEKATVENIRTAINDVAKVARKEDLVVMYFSSHGTAASSDVAMEDAKSGYIVTHETNLSNLYATAFAMEELRRVVQNRIGACRVVMFLDTCFSGDTVAPAAAGSKMLAVGITDSSKERIAQGAGRVVIASSRNDERSWESEKIKNSYFTHYLIDALRSKRGLADITTVFTHLQNSVPRAVRTEMGARQTPVMWPEGRRLDIVIGTAID